MEDIQAVCVLSNNRSTSVTLNIPRLQTPSAHIIYILVSHDREPLAFPFPIFLTFGLSGRYLDFSLRLPLLVTLPNLCRSSILSERRSYLFLSIQVQEYRTL